MSYYEDFKNILECPVCYGRMCSPIWMCQNGHNVCSTCRPSLQICPICKENFITGRNIALEQISERVPVACPNKKYGCDVFMHQNAVRAHEKDCLFKAITCQMVSGCSWKGTIDQLIDHWTLKENNKLYITSQSLRLTDLKNTKNFINLITHESILFWLKVQQTNNAVYWTVEVINKNVHPSMFYFELVILNSDMLRRKVVLSEYCSFLTEGFEHEVFDGSKAVSIRKYNLERYLDEHGSLLFDIKVQRIAESDKPTKNPCYNPAKETQNKTDLDVFVQYQAIPHDTSAKQVQAQQPQGSTDENNKKTNKKKKGK